MQSPPGTRAGINKIYAKVYRHHLNYHAFHYSASDGYVKHLAMVVILIFSRQSVHENGSIGFFEEAGYWRK